MSEARLIIRLITQTIRRDPSGADQIDVEHQATDLAVGGSKHPLAHHLGEGSLVDLLLLGGTGLLLMLVEGRARVTAARARLTRCVRGTEQRPHDGGR